MILEPFNTPCRACVSTGRVLRFCASRCVPAGLGAYTSAERIGDPQLPHLHAKCMACGFEWLERTLGFEPVNEASE